LASSYAQTKALTVQPSEIGRDQLSLDYNFTLLEHRSTCFPSRSRAKENITSSTPIIFSSQ
jgi:hypothetical protein